MGSMNSKLTPETLAALEAEIQAGYNKIKQEHSDFFDSSANNENTLVKMFGWVQREALSIIRSRKAAAQYQQDGNAPLEQEKKMEDALSGAVSLARAMIFFESEVSKAGQPEIAEKMYSAANAFRELATADKPMTFDKAPKESKAATSAQRF